jgi:putative transposase
MLNAITAKFGSAARQRCVMERLFGEVKRRSHKMAAAFCNERSCLLLFYAVIRSLNFNKLTMPAPAPAQPDLHFYTILDILP